MSDTASTILRVDMALFKGDELLERGEILVGADHRTEAFSLFQVEYHLASDAAHIILYGFADGIDLKRAALNVPIHESDDWESIQLAAYTLGFWCRLGS